MRKRFPEARIDWVVEDRAEDLLRHRPDLDRVVVYPREALSAALAGVPALGGLLRGARAFLRTLREVAYDVVLDLQGNLKSGAVARASRAGIRFGFDRSAVREGNQIFSTRRWFPPRAVEHRVERNLGLLAALLGAPCPYVDPGFPVPAEVRSRARNLVHALALPAAGYVVLHPGTSGFGSFKRWPPARFAALAEQIAGTGRAVAVTCSPSERALGEDVVGATRGRAVLVPTPSLPVLAEVVREAAAFVAADTGPLHLASLVGTPLVGLFGPKSPRVYGPYGIGPDGHAGPLVTVTQPDVACRPCTLRRCADPLCMRTMEPGTVYEALASVLARPAVRQAESPA